MNETAPPTTPEEARLTLCDLARKRFGALPVEGVVRHAMRMTEGADWPVQKAALEALIRRFRSSVEEGLVVASRPSGNSIYGAYATGRKETGRRQESRPYTTTIYDHLTLRGSCNCSDFLQSSLGFCKHLSVVWQHIYGSAPRLRRAEREQAAGVAPPVLGWEPMIPLVGAVDRLRGLRRDLGGKGKLPAGWLAGPDTLAFPDPQLLKTPASRGHFLTTLAKLSSGVDPAARALIQNEIERAARRAECERTAVATLRHLASVKRTLYPYQVEGIERFVRAGRLVLADDMGLGKTTQAIAACHALAHAGRIRRGVLLVPSPLKSQWLREWEATTDLPATVVDGSPSDRAARYAGFKKGFLILNYELLLKDFVAISQLRADLIVVDEAQRMKNWATKSAAYIKALTPRYRLLLTGTPMENRLDELASVFDWVDDVALCPKWRLEPHFTFFESTGGRNEGGGRHLHDLRARLASGMIRRRRQEVLRQLPSRTDTRVPVPMTEQQRVEHDDLVPPIAALMARAARRPLMQKEFLFLMQLLTTQRIVSNGLGQLRFQEMWPFYQRHRPTTELLEGLFSPKLVEFRSLLKELLVGQERKVVVFSQWRSMLRLAEWSVRDVLHDSGLRAVFFTGAESQKLRTQSVVEFHDELTVPVMFLSDAGGVGLNLQRAASACINLEMPWNPAVLEQRIGRIYRLGQERPIDVFNLVSEYGIEQRIADLVAGKMALFSGLFDGSSDTVRFDAGRSFLSVAKQLADVQAPVIPEVPVLENAGEDDEEIAETSTKLAESDEGAVPTENETEFRSSNESSTDIAPRSLNESSPLSVDLAQAMATLRVTRTEGGGLAVEAPPGAAEPLAALFETMARLLRAEG